MVLEGTVSNVAQFGAFVDLGVHQDGLVHVSQLSQQVRQRCARGRQDRRHRQGQGAGGRRGAQAHRLTMKLDAAPAAPRRPARQPLRRRARRGQRRQRPAAPRPAAEHRDGRRLRQAAAGASSAHDGRRALRIYAGPRARAPHRAQRAARRRTSAWCRARPAAPRAWCSGRSTASSSASGCRARSSRSTWSAPPSAPGAWRRPAWPTPVAAFERLERDYIAQDYELRAGPQDADGARTSASGSARTCAAFYGGRVRRGAGRIRATGCTSSPRAGATCWRASTASRTPLGYLGAFLTNSVHRRALGAWLERVVFSTRARCRGAARCPSTTGTSARARCT